MGHGDIRPLEVSPRVGRPGDDDPVLIDDLVDGPRLERSLALVRRAVEVLHTLFAVGPLPDDDRLIVIDPHDGIVPWSPVRSPSSFRQHGTSN